MRRRSQGKKKGILIILAVVIAGLVVIKTASYAPFLFQLVFNKNIELKKTSDQRVNILLLGIGGGTHDGPDLTDTIIFASVDPVKNRTTLISIPRDLWVTDLQGKINTAYADGESKKKGGGLVEAEAAVSKIMGQPVDYGIRIDFGGFAKAVDQVGGLDVTVDDAFDDYAYPIEGKEDDTCGFDNQKIIDLTAQISTGSASDTDAFPCRYMHVHFDKGLQHMNGQQALEFVRSRHAFGPEGTDFARSKRQQKVITAFRDKLISAQTLFNPSAILNLYGDLKNSIDTDIKQDEYDDFIRLAQKMKSAPIVNGALDQGDSSTGRPGLLVNPVPSAAYSFAWILLPAAGDSNYSQIQGYVSCMILESACDFFHLTPTPVPIKSSKSS